MGVKDDREKIVRELIKRGDEKIHSAEILLKNKLYEDSISRSYYAAFLAVKALLLLLGSSPKTHNGIITMLSLKVIKEGIISETIGKDFSYLLEAIQNSDYAIFTYYNAKDSEELLEKAQNIITTIKEVLKEKFHIQL